MKMLNVVANGMLNNGVKTSVEQSRFGHIKAHIENEIGRHGFVRKNL